MQFISEINIRSFRSVSSVRLQGLGHFTALAGLNNAGKSNILRALNSFFTGYTDGKTPLSVDDDYFRPHLKKKKAKTIRIEIRFSLPALFKFQKRIQGVKAFLGGAQFEIAKEWNRGVAAPAYFLNGGTALDPPGRDQIDKFLSLISFRYIPNRVLPLDIIRSEHQALRDVLVRRFAKRAKGRASDFKTLEETSAALIKSINAHVTEACPGVGEVRLATPKSWQDMIFAFGYKLASGGVEIDDVVQGSGIQSLLMLETLSLIDRDYFQQFGWRQAAVWALEDSSLSYHAARRVTDHDIFDNRLIFGDNLLALKALEQEFAGKIKCVFIDPPYNTGSAFQQYDDSVEHSLWLSLMRDRLELLRRLLRRDGSVWITIDDNEAHYLKVLCDELFGRTNFVSNVVWQKRTSPDVRATVGAGHDHVLVFAKDINALKPTVNSVSKTPQQLAQYKNPDSDPRGPWVSSDYTAQGFRPNQMYKITTPGGAEYYPPKGVCWKNVEPVFMQLVAEGRIWFGRDGKGMPRRKTYLSESEGSVPWTWWPNDEVGHTQESKKESIALFGAESAFDTPKPERLLKRVIEVGTNPGDWVLDSFAGSGTTGAVAHKMGRRWIMVELGDHCQTHIIPRLKKVIDGADPGGITDAVGWKGGGGFRYFRLAPSLLEKDRWGNWVVSKKYNAEMLAEAICKLEGFTYAPSDTVYWQHGRSTERDFIYLTTQKLTHAQLAALSEEVGEDRSLLVFCMAFRAKPDAFPNLTVKKIPTAVLNRCEWGRDDYSLQVRNLPSAPEPAPAEDSPPKRHHSKERKTTMLPLLDEIQRS